jgi:hypothetical protein
MAARAWPCTDLHWASLLQSNRMAHISSALQFSGLPYSNPSSVHFLSNLFSFLVFFLCCHLSIFYDQLDQKMQELCTMLNFMRNFVAWSSLGRILIRKQKLSFLPTAICIYTGSDAIHTSLLTTPHWRYHCPADECTFFCVQALHWWGTPLASQTSMTIWQ